MYSLWLVSEDSALPATLALHLEVLGAVETGPPEIGRFKEANAPDLLVAAGGSEGGPAALERLLGFLRAIPQVRRAPAPVLYIESPGDDPTTSLLARLVDDRPLRILPWPLEPPRLVREARILLSGSELPPSLRERARRSWVGDQVERLYAGLELPPLRHAIDPRNAARPVLLVGEPGTRRGLLARYIHNLAEPAREELIALSAPALAEGRVEETILDRCRGLRSTVFLKDVERASSGVQEELAQLLGESGALGIEPIRWIASATRSDALVATLDGLPWLRVSLPPLRARPDFAELARALVTALSATQGRPRGLATHTVDALMSYLWPGNLRELEAVLVATLQSAPGDEVEPSDIRMGTAGSLSALGSLDDATDEAPEEVDVEPETLPTGLLPELRGETEPTSAREEHGALTIRSIVSPLAEEIRPPLRALRTLSHLLDQRPDDAGLRRELSGLVEGDLSRIEGVLQKIERFSGFGAPEPAAVDLPGLVAGELQQRQSEIRERSLVVLRELDHDAPAALADEKQIGFAIGALLDRALRMVPEGGDLYVGSLYRPAREEAAAGHRLLIRFHSPEDVLVNPADVPGPSVPVEVVLARELIENMGGVFAVDASGSQDNVVLIELPSS